MLKVVFSSTLMLLRAERGAGGAETLISSPHLEEECSRLLHQGAAPARVRSSPSVLVVVVATVAVKVTRKERDESISCLEAGAGAGVLTCGLQQQSLVALLLVPVGGGQQNLVLRTGPEAPDHVAAGVPVQQDLQTDRRTPSSTSSSQRPQMKEDTHVLGVPSVRGGPDEPVQNHVLGRVLPGHPEAVRGDLAAPEVQRFWNILCGHARR